jgi:cyclopropane fatty-acyl-phospholipid synthase-like methyltransferase
VELLEVKPHHRLLEIGPGGGVAMALVCEGLDGGKITGLDRSARAADAARRRLAGEIERGVAQVEHLALERAEFPPGTFDTVFAVNVNDFWTAPPQTHLARVRDWLKPDGVLVLVYEPPAPQRASAIEERIAPAMRAAGFDVTTTTQSTTSGAMLLALIGRSRKPD